MNASHINIPALFMERSMDSGASVDVQVISKSPIQLHLSLGESPQQQSYGIIKPHSPGAGPMARISSLTDYARKYRYRVGAPSEEP